jgi:ABC-type transporter Mla subunit MlaD
MTDQERPDPFGDVINLLAAPIAGGLRSIEHMKRGVEELFRAVDNLNRTMENLNEAAERINRFMADVEEPVRSMLPQLARTVRAADELMELVEAPARRVAPNIGRIAETLGSPAFTSLPNQLNDFMTVMGDVSRRLGPLAQFAESAGGMFGFRLPGVTRPSAEPTPAAAPRVEQREAPTARQRTGSVRSAGATTSSAKRAAPATTKKKSGAKGRSGRG